MSSCHLQQHTTIKNLHDVRSFLLNTNESEVDERWDEEGWTKNWDFDNVNQQSLSETTAADDDLEWIQTCSYAFSPLGDFMCFALKDKAIFLSGEYAVKSFSDKVPGQLSVSYKGILSEEESEIITDVLCIPLVSLSQTSHGSRDWTCTLVGFSSGYVRMYSETGALLIAELLHESPVVQLSCRTYDTTFNSAYNMSAEHRDELTILYGDSLISVEGFSLFQTLRACRSQLAVATARGSNIIDPPPLSYKKWVLRGQDKIAAHISTGIMTTTPFQQMHTACVTYGFSTDVRSGTTAMSQFVTVGSAPFTGFYYAVEGSTQPFLSHVALAVASKLKSALFNAASGWLSWGQSSSAEQAAKSKPKKKVEIGSQLDIRFGLPDLLRHANSIIISPGAGWLAAITDSFGRVMLLDVVKAQALRMWKGYRDAQIGFVRTSDDNYNTKSTHCHGDGVARMALFLVIFAPRRGILEVWSCINGPRVGTFNIDKNSRLIYPGYGMFGLHNKRDSGGYESYAAQCCVMSGNGQIKEVVVPFHLALSDSNSNKARDIHLLKKVGQMLQPAEKDGNEVMKLILEMRVPSVQMQALKKFLLSSGVGCEIFKQCFASIENKLKDRDLRKEEADLLCFLKAQDSLLDLYLSFMKLSSISSEKDEDTNPDGISKELNITTSEAERVINLVSEFKIALDRIATEPESTQPLEVSEFLRCFVVTSTDNYQHKIASNSSAKMKTLGRFLFNSSLFGGTSPQDVIDAINSTIALPIDDVMLLMFEHWKSSERLIMKDLASSISSLKRFVEMFTSKIVDDDDENHLNTWREWVKRDVCSPSKNIVASYILALVCRSIDVAIRSEEVNVTCADTEPPTYEEAVHGKQLGGWETLWPELENWNLLIKQFEDCVCINTALYIGHDEKETQFREQKERERISVYDLLHNGTGFIPEVIAEKICDLQLLPEAIVSDSSSDEGTSSSDQKDVPSAPFIDYLWKKLIPRFTKFLSSTSIHAHCFWQEMLIWNRDPEVISHMKRAIDHLELVTYDAHTKHGLALMAWRTFIFKRFTSLAKLVDKVGRAPKDRLCRKETGMSGPVIAKFCHNCTYLLQIIANTDPDQIPKPPVDVEQVYETPSSLSFGDDTWQDVVGKESIMDMGKNHPTANFALLYSSMHLSFILDGIMEFTLRGVKPLSHLFDRTTQYNFLVDFATSRITPSPPFIDAETSKHRFQFLCKLVKAVVHRMYKLRSEEDHIDNDLRDWIETSIHMGAEFQLDDSLIKIHYICELYKHGLDMIGVELLKTTGNDEELALRLMVVAGQRLNHFLMTTSPEDGVIILSQMPSSLSTWVKSQNPRELDVPDVSSSLTLSLAREVITMIPESNTQFNLALYLVEALSVVVNS